jgi:hypothetical protein
VHGDYNGIKIRDKIGWLLGTSDDEGCEKQCAKLNIWSAIIRWNVQSLLLVKILQKMLKIVQQQTLVWTKYRYLF